MVGGLASLNIVRPLESNRHHHNAVNTIAVLGSFFGIRISTFLSLFSPAAAATAALPLGTPLLGLNLVLHNVITVIVQRV